MLTDFVDRVESLAAFNVLVDDLSRGRGGTLVFEGHLGMGKSSLLDFLGESARTANGPGIRVVEARCTPEIGTGLQYAPVIDVLRGLQAQRTRAQRFREGFRRSAVTATSAAPEVLAALVPGLEHILTLGKEVTKAALATGSIPLDSLLPFQHGAAQQIADTILSLARSGSPVVLLIDDIHDIDPSSLHVLDRLLPRLSEAPLALVLSHEPRTSPKSTRGLLDRWENGGLATRHTLVGLPVNAIAELVLRKHPTAPAQPLSMALSEITAGHPVFVRMCLDAWKDGDGPSPELPAGLARVVESRFAPLDVRDQELLEVAASQGALFFSPILARALGAEHEEVMGRLRRIAQVDELITLVATPPDWAGAESKDCYTFQHRALWDVVYKRQTPAQLCTRHAKIAAAWGDGRDESVPLARRLEIARHLRLGGAECLADSADVHYALARSAATEGMSYAEAEEHCAEAIRAARALPRRQEGRDRRLADAIELLLSLTEVRWRGQHEAAGPPGDIDGLAAEAEEAAERVGEPELVARTTLLRGKTLLATRGVEPSLVKLRQAMERAEVLDDRRPSFVARVEYGRQVGKRDLAESLRQLTEAERMYACEPSLGGRPDPVLQHARNLGEMQLGIAHFDSGHLGEALTRLERCTDRLRHEALHAELPIALNYLAQVRFGLGDLPGARAALEEARAFEAERGGDSGWHAYNTALLAFSFADSAHAAHAAEDRAHSRRLIEAAWEETTRTWLINLVPIVRNLYAEVLLRTSGRDAPAGERDHDLRQDLHQAERLAEATIAETRGSGMVRSEIAARCLLGRVSLRLGRVDEAAHRLDQALRILNEVGDMPALRTEEVYYYAALTHRAAGHRDRGRELLDRARAEVARKAGHIHDPELLELFRQEPLNRLIADDDQPSQ
ncbi:AAA family ATPase [Actinacidiphila yeochonensis]|uniref:AAA family ATPase n=1 Tax=Actinacidiphila yeochonensis TaxID=89050 RepID=UPI0005669F34|nr:AAA family ATPase [Actinacidiphila yeochonensis]